MTGVGLACALTALTTAVAFASITLTGTAQLFEFAVLGAIGTMLSFGVDIVTFALLGRIIPFSDRPFRKPLHGGEAARPRVMIEVCIPVLSVAAFG